MAGMILDHQIRSRSNGEFTLNDLMKEIYKTHSRDNLYSSDSILKILLDSMALDFSPFFERYIYGNEVIPVGNYFDIGMLMFGAPIESKNQQVLANMLTFE